MFYNTIQTHCGQTTEQELKIATTELAAMQGLYDAIGSVIKVYGGHVVQESKLVDVHSWLVINLPEKREQVEKLSAKLNEEIANRPTQPKTVTVPQEEWEKLQAATNPEPKACDWKYLSAMGLYKTECGENTRWDGSLPLYCQFCGGSIRA